MPWGNPYGTAVCDDCLATTQKSDYTGIDSFRKAGAWCPKHTGGEVMLCPKCVVKEIGDDDVYKRWNGRISLQLTEKSARKLFDEHWNPAPGEAALATPPGLDDRRMGRRGESEARVEGLEVRIEQLEKEVEEFKTLVKHQDAILKQVAAKVAMWSWFDGEGGNR